MANYGNSGYPYGNMMIWGFTDVSKYVDWSTYIDFTHGSYPGSPTHDYVLYLQYWDGDSWNNINEVHIGYFANSVTKRWYLAGMPAGSYRIRGVYTPRGGSPGINQTNAFIVER